MIIKTDMSSFLLDEVQGFYIESDLDYNYETDKYDIKGYVIWATLPHNYIRVTKVLPKEEAEAKLTELTQFWCDYSDDIVAIHNIE